MIKRIETPVGDSYPIDKLSKIIGKNIKNARVKKDWSQEYLAERVGVSTASVSMWESGKRLPSIDSILKINSLLNTQIADVSSEPVDSQTDLWDDLISDKTDEVPTIGSSPFDDDDDFLEWGETAYPTPKKSATLPADNALTADEQEMLEAYRNASTSAKMQAYQILIKGSF